ncbi:MAG: caspase family protein [Propylenella sp.]
MTTSRIFGFLALAAAMLFSGAEQAEARRIALVIGNDSYQELPVLQKAGTDATDFAAVLEEKNFDAVLLRKNLSRLEMDLALSDFLETIAPGDTAVFFYSGHGWSDGSQNFLVGTDVPKTASGAALSRLSIALQNGANGIIDSMDQHGATLKIVIVDACRDNPFVSAIAGRSIGIGRGLTRVEPPNGTFVVFSAGAGQVALDRLSDNDAERNSVFTRTFLPLVRSDLPLLDIVKTTQEKVYELALKVSHDQEPAYYDQVRGAACLSLSCRTPGSQAPATTSAPEEKPAGPGVGLSVDAETKFWIAIQNSNNPAEYKAFLQAFPDGNLTTLARIRLESVEPAFWQAMSSSGQRADFERYLEFYPEGRHAEEAKARLANVETAALQPSPPPGEVHEEVVVPEQVAILRPPAVDEVAVPALSGRELFVALQEVLKRAGCYASSIDGDWGPRSQRGLENLLKRASLAAAPEPSAQTYEVIKAVTERVCPIEVAPAKPKRTTAARTTQRRSNTVQQQQQFQEEEPQSGFRARVGVSGGNPRAACAGILSPADPNFESPSVSRSRFSSC